MNIGRHWLVIILILLSCYSTLAGEGQLRPVDLRCEYRANPLAIDVSKPRLSWILEPRNPNVRGLAQIAYQILVSSSEERLRKNLGDLWQTGKVASDRSIQVPYQGLPLASRQRVWWKVRVWDNTGKASDWSAPAGWSMGLLKPEEWHAKWIGLDGGEGKPEELKAAHWIWSAESGPGTRYFRRRIDIAPGNPASRAWLNMIGSGDTTVYVNGLPCGYMGCLKGNYRTAKGVNDPFVVGFIMALHTGTNILTATVTSSGGPAGLIGAIDLDFASGESKRITTDAEWRVSTSAPPGWETGEFNDASWEAAKSVGPYGMSPWGEVGWANHRLLPARMLRKEFKVEADVKRATLYISGLGVSEPFLNGAKVSDDVLVPALSEYPKRVFYLTYDVTKLVKPGANAVGVILGNGRFFAQRHKGFETFGFPKLLLQLEIEYHDGKVERVLSDESWKLTTDGPIRANNEYDGEIYDARQEMAGWSRAGFDDRGWQSARAVQAPGGALAAQMIAPIRVTETLKPMGITQPRPGVYIFDMGQNMVGWCRLSVSGPAGTKVTLRHAELLQPNGTLSVNSLGSAQATDVYILKGRGVEVYEPRFVYHGFRFVEVTGFPGVPTLSSLEGREVHDALEERGEFATSNPLLNRIYKNAVWGTKDNYRSVPTDCPQRDERQGWLGDRSAESLGETYLFDVAAFYAKWMDDIEDTQRSDGSIADVAPGFWHPYNDNVTWPASFLLIPGYLYDQYGDLQVIARHYEAMKKWITYMQQYLKDDLMPRDNYGDWCYPPESHELMQPSDPDRRTDGVLIGTAYYCHLLRLMGRYATLLGKPADAKSFGNLADRLVVAFNHKWLDSQAGRYSNGSQTSSILPLAFGMVPEADRERVLETLVRNIMEQNHGHLATGLIGCQWLLQVLTDNGHPEVAYEIAAQKTFPSWGYMVSKGATTIWEVWNNDLVRTASFNHVMLVGDLVTWFYEDLVGIRPDPAQPGFKHIIMRPPPSGTWLSSGARTSLPMVKLRATGNAMANASPGASPCRQTLRELFTCPPVTRRPSLKVVSQPAKRRVSSFSVWRKERPFTKWGPGVITLSQP
jgi:alpha-L-rhamnosidase